MKFLRGDDFNVYVRGSVEPAIIDEEDVKKIIGRAFFLDPQGYARTNSVKKFDEQRGANLRLQNIILGPSTDEQGIIFINGDRLDCRKRNLSYATKQIRGGMEKISKNNTSGFKGVSWSASNNKWQAMVWDNSRKLYLGCFDNKLDAAKAYDAALIRKKGPNAMTNFKMGLYE